MCIFRLEREMRLRNWRERNIQIYIIWSQFFSLIFLTSIIYGKNEIFNKDTFKANKYFFLIINFFYFKNYLLYLRNRLFTLFDWNGVEILEPLLKKRLISWIVYIKRKKIVFTKCLYYTYTDIINKLLKLWISHRFICKPFVFIFTLRIVRYEDTWHSVANVRCLFILYNMCDSTQVRYVCITNCFSNVIYFIGQSFSISKVHYITFVFWQYKWLTLVLYIFIITFLMIMFIIIYC